MSLPAQKPAGVKTSHLGVVPAAPTSRRLKRGEIVFAEGDTSRAMYYIKAGVIRIFKKKGDAQIEIDTVHSGHILGELAFLDGNPRSASAEVLTDCELIEISGPTFQQVVASLPEWLKILLKTVVGRLRTAGTRIRQLESSSSSYDYSGPKDAKGRQSNYIYLSPTDVLKIATALLLVAARNGKPAEKGIEVRVSLLQRYANQIMGVPVAKVTSFLDVLAEMGAVSFSTEAVGTGVVLNDIDFVEQLISYLNEQNLVEPAKRHDLTSKSFYVMKLVAKHLDKYVADATTGFAEVNLAHIMKLEREAEELTEDPFRIDDFSDLSKFSYATNVNMKSASEIFTSLKPEAFKKAFRFQQVVMAIRELNEQKREATNRR